MKTPHSPVAGPRPDLLRLLQEGGRVPLNPEAVIPIHSDAALEYRVWVMMDIEVLVWSSYIIQTPKSKSLKSVV